MKMQLDFEKELNELHGLYGHKNSCPISGAGCVNKPRWFFIFMNPTAKNISADKKWKGLRAPWLGTKNIWKMLYKLDLITPGQFEFTQKAKSKEWNEKSCLDIYETLAKNKTYITNLAKCTQEDARALPNKIFREYIKIILEEVQKTNPEKIVTFGVQVSSILLDKRIEIKSEKKEELVVGKKTYSVFPTYYPVGQGMRNLQKAVERIKRLK